MRSARRAAGVALLAVAVLVACGSRTGLPLLQEDTAAPAATPKTNAFCLHTDYAAGFADVSLYLLLDDSASMADDHKWDLATAALAAFVDDPNAAGLSVGIQYFPLGSSCDADQFARPAVPIAVLPANASRIKASLSQHSPTGDTPTLPALQGGIEYARALIAGDSTRAVVVAMLTDGTPDDCMSTTANVALTAASGVSSEPQVLTFVLGMETGEVAAMDRIAAAGGTGKAILIGKDPTSAQQIVSSLKALRDAHRLCQYGVPSDATAHPTASDLSVTARLQTAGPDSAVSFVSGAADCGVDGGFFTDDADHPTKVTLCPVSCDRVHTSSGSRVTITAGCGLGTPDAGVTKDSGAGSCPGFTSISCVPSCGSVDTSTQPVCVGSNWTCPPGTVSSDDCNICPPVPHGCCKSDGTLAPAQCVSSAWVCPPGAESFGAPGCAPPEVCAPLLFCGVGQYCKVPDFTCLQGNLPGACAPLPATCTNAGPAVCGCDGVAYPNECAAAASGIDLSAVVACPAPAGTFACGPLFCRSNQICEHTNDLTKAIAPSSYACIDAPQPCPNGCGCGLCGPCPNGLTCKEACSLDQGANHVLTCTRL